MKTPKSAKLRTASRLVGYIGIGACLLAAFAYLLMHEIANDTLKNTLGEFNIKSLIYVAIAAGVFFIVAVILRICAGVAKRDEELDVEEPVEEVPAEEPAEEVPAEEPAEEVVEEPAKPTNKIILFINEHTTEKQRAYIAKAGEFTKKHADVIIAVAVTLAVAGAIHKNKEEKALARRRKSFFRSLGC